jgi:rRNA biogenesis protein RRP5
MSASVKSIEDHGYVLNLGISDVSGFLSFKDAKKALESSSKLAVGCVIDVSISKLSSNGRTCNVTISPASIKASYVWLHLSLPCLFSKLCLLAERGYKRDFDSSR